MYSATLQLDCRKREGKRREKTHPPYVLNAGTPLNLRTPENYMDLQMILAGYTCFRQDGTHTLPFSPLFSRSTMAEPASGIVAIHHTVDVGGNLVCPIEGLGCAVHIHGWSTALRRRCRCCGRCLRRRGVRWWGEEEKEKVDSRHSPSAHMIRDIIGPKWNVPHFLVMCLKILHLPRFALSASHQSSIYIIWARRFVYPQPS
ncbi:hypothetical protein R3P38DRAFT_1331904 [Favolaschia claudopus]|uniref:Uncharacterized protein n=1 Tax=Favolaschia claudopus TaxID=2862362 RepID=A0AAW0AWQ7_9AGAR